MPLKNFRNHLLTFFGDVLKRHQFLHAEVGDLIGAVVRKLVEITVQAGDRTLAVAHTLVPSETFVAFPVFKSIFDPPDIFLVLGLLVLQNGVIDGFELGAAWTGKSRGSVLHPLLVCGNTHFRSPRPGSMKK